MRRKLFIGFLCLLLLTLVGAHGYYFFHTTLSYTAKEQKESTQALSNPYCGFYQIHGFPLEDQQLAKANDWVSNLVANYQNSLVLLEINLKNYKNKDLSQDAKDELATILSHYADANIGILLRFVYDWDGHGFQNEPTHLSTIKKHMAQVSDIVNTYRSHILLHQGIFTGDCGEMHHTHYGSDEAITELMSYLATQLDSSIFLAVRTPAHRRTILADFSSLDASSAYTSSLASRLGLFNDGMMGDALDCGTYGDKPLDSHGLFSQKGTREEELAYQNALCQYVPNGGEVVLNNSYNDLPDAIETLTTMHVSYLNELHDSTVIEKWKNTAYTGDSLFQNISGFEYIKRHLGYRFFLKESSLRENTLSLQIANHGFAPCYRKLEATLIIKCHSTGEENTIPVDCDSRAWLSQTTQIVNIPLPACDLKADTYDLLFQLEDPVTHQFITFANESMDSNLRIPLGTLTVS